MARPWGSSKKRPVKSGVGGGERERDEIRRPWKAVLRTLNFSSTECFFWPCSKIYLY